MTKPAEQGKWIKLHEFMSVMNTATGVVIETRRGRASHTVSVTAVFVPGEYVDNNGKFHRRDGLPASIEEIQ